jgi:hypothetical protein
MKSSVQIGSGAMIYSYIPSFIKISSVIQNFNWRDTKTQTGWRLHKPIFIFLK